MGHRRAEEFGACTIASGCGCGPEAGPFLRPVPTVNSCDIYFQAFSHILWLCGAVNQGAQLSPRLENHCISYLDTVIGPGVGM